MEVLQTVTTATDNHQNMDLGDMDIDMDVDLGPVEDEIGFHVKLAVAPHFPGDKKRLMFRVEYRRKPQFCAASKQWGRAGPRHDHYTSQNPYPWC